MNDDIRPVPVVIGVGDIINRSLRVEDAVEPLELMLNAIQKALQDTGLSDAAQASLQSAIDSLEVVSSWTWSYADLPKSIGKRLGIAPRHTGTSAHGGNQPAKLFDEAARRISKQESKVAIVVGGEALASCMSPL
jgi:acetyl-CoA acetyltransferase